MEKGLLSGSLETMPVYEYKCQACGDVFEVRQKFVDEPLTVHEKCGGKVERLISVSALQFKGTGWYVTDYGKGNSKDPQHKSDGSNGAGKSEKQSGGDSSGKSETSSKSEKSSNSEKSEKSSKADNSSSSTSTPSASKSDK
jgi:putative FmdB family regulatory protein